MSASVQASSRTRIPAAEAAEQLQDIFRRMAAALRPSDLALQDDLIQEMSVAVLAHETRQVATRSYWICLANYRAKDYLRKEKRREHEQLPDDDSNDDDGDVDAAARELLRALGLS